MEPPANHASEKSKSSKIDVWLQRYSLPGIAWRLFITCWLIYTLHFATNTVREIFPAMSLGDSFSFDVSEYMGFHPDIFEVPGRGAFINNNPGASILGAIPYVLTRPLIERVVDYVNLTRSTSNAEPPQYDTIYPMAREFYKKAYERGLDVKFGLAAGVMQSLLMAPLSALSVVLMFYLLKYLMRSVKKSLLYSLLYAFATPIFYRTAQLNHNLLVAHCAFFAFILLWKPWDERVNRPKSDFLFAGLLAGWALVLDYSGLIVLAFIGLYAVIHIKNSPGYPHSVNNLVYLGVGLLVSISVLLIYQWQAFGNPFYPPQHYMPQTTYSGFGYQGIDWPKVDLLLLNTFGIRYGLFISAPIFLLALYIPAWLRRPNRYAPFPGLLNDIEKYWILAFSFAFLVFTAANQFSRMQFNSGIRHLLPVVPFLFLMVADVLRMLPAIAQITIGVVGTYWSWCLAMYRDVEQGLGVLESIFHISTNGPQLPWLMTLKRLGMVPDFISAVSLIVFSAFLICALWLLPFSRPKGA